MNRYKIVETVNDGSFGIVYKATNDAGGFVAIKKMKRRFRHWQECMELREVKALKRLSHPNIVKLREVVRENDELFFVLEYCERNLYQVMTKEMADRPFREDQIRLIMFQVLSALSFTHQEGFFHRDIKPENLLCSGGIESIKLADFGLARDLHSAPPFTDYVATRWYRAPEILLKFRFYSWPVDIWAAGAVMAELFLMHPVFPGTSEIDELHKIYALLGVPTAEDWPELAGHLASNFVNPPTPTAPVPLEQWIPMASPQAVELISSLLQLNPAKRPSAKAALKFPFFQAIVAPE